MVANGHNGRVEFDGVNVVITGKGLVKTSAKKGQNRIPVTSITAVNWKAAGFVGVGYIRFVVPGYPEGQITFTRGQMADFQDIREAVEEQLGELTSYSSEETRPSIVEQISKLADLHASGVLNAEEFSAAKVKLLNG